MRWIIRVVHRSVQQINLLERSDHLEGLTWVRLWIKWVKPFRKMASINLRILTKIPSSLDTHTPYTHTHRHTHNYTHTHIHTYTHIHTQSYTHAHMWCVDVLMCCDGLMTLCWCVDVLMIVLMTCVDESCWYRYELCWWWLCYDALVCWCVGVLMCWCVGDCAAVLMRWCVDVLIGLKISVDLSQTSRTSLTSSRSNSQQKYNFFNGQTCIPTRVKPELNRGLELIGTQVRLQMRFVWFANLETKKPPHMCRSGSNSNLIDPVRHFQYFEVKHRFDSGILGGLTSNGLSAIR